MMKNTAHRRQKVIRDAPFILKSDGRLFCVGELTVEFKRITTVSLLSKFFSELGAHSANLSRRKIKSIVIPITQTDTIDVRREWIIKALCVRAVAVKENRLSHLRLV